MKIRLLPAILSGCMTLAFCASGADLIENGDLKDDLNYWKLHRHAGYKPEPTTRYTKGELSFSGLTFLTKYYLSLSQAVEIKKGVKYKLSYEIKGPATKTYTIRLGDPGDRGNNIEGVYHYIDHKLTAPADWQTVEVEFTGKFDTDRNWYRKVTKARKYNTFSSKTGQARAPRAADVVEVDPEDRPCVTTLGFYFGSLEGRVSIRNISIVEVD